MKTVQLGIRLDRGEVVMLKKIARSEDTDVSKLVRRAIRRTYFVKKNSLLLRKDDKKL